MKVPSLTIAIPAYNEEASLPAVIKDVLTVGPTVTNSLELLLVNDGSTDKTLHIMKKAALADKRITVYNHPKNKGFSGAIKSCYRKAKSEWIFLAPADGQISMDILPSFIKETTHADVVVGYRTSNPEPLSRKINSYVFHWLFRNLFQVRLKEISTAILWRKKILDAIHITADDRSALIQPEVIAKAWHKKARFASMGFAYHIRTGGIPKGTNVTMILITIKELIRLRIQM
jgi:glycosyltransferase involved in cell wall biosynthesis